MAETRFIKTVTFGGYDKSDVDERLEKLYTQIYDLKNELKEAKNLLETYKKGTEGEKAFDAVLAAEREKLTELQVKNGALSERIKAAEEDVKQKDAELAEAKNDVEELKSALADTNISLAALQTENDAEALSIVFIEAKKSAELLIANAKKQASDLEADSRQLAESTVADADNKAAKIIYDAEKYAAELTAEALNRSEQMNAASDNLRTIMLEDISKLSSSMNTIRAALNDFEQSGHALAESTGKLLEDTETQLRSGGAPVFKVPDNYVADLPKEPVFRNVNFRFDASKENAKERNAEELNRLKEMAETLTANVHADNKAGSAEAPVSEEKEKEKENNTDQPKVPDLAELAKMAGELNADTKKDEGTKEHHKKTENNRKKSGEIDLAELARQAAELNK